jgi:hypothetical protein
VSAGVALARALARPRGAARLVPARIRGALLRKTIERLLRARGLDELLALLAGESATATATPATSTSTATWTGETVAGLRRLPASCLHRALAGYAALRGAGEDPRFVIGVRRDGEEIVAHAWIEQAGVPVGEPDDPRARFTVAYAHPAPTPARRQADGEEMAAPRPSPDVILTRLADGTGVLLHLGTKFYFALNATGVVVWEALAAGEPVDADRLAALLVGRFAGVDRDRARADVEALLRDLAAEGLLAKGA